MDYFLIDLYLFSYSVITEYFRKLCVCAPPGMQHMQLTFDYIELLYLRPFLVEQQKQA